MTKPSLRLANVSHRYETRLVLDALDLTLADGEVFCLVGPSGCGKSTTLRLIAGLEPLQHGEIEIGGHPVAGPGHFVPPELRQTGFVFQDFALFPHLSVAENVAFGLAHMPREQRMTTATAYLARVRLGHLAAQLPHQLSGGEQQRVALARALAAKPKLILMDEPFSGLDTRLRDTVRNETLTLIHETRTPVLLVTHDPTEAMRLADRIGVMQDGRLLQVGTPREIYQSPVTSFVAGFLGPINRLKMNVSGQRIATPFGEFAALGAKDGAEAEFVIRREGIQDVVSSTTGYQVNSAEAQITRVTFLGPVSDVQLEVEGLPAPLMAQLAGDQFVPGQKLRIALDPAKAFVFV